MDDQDEEIDKDPGIIYIDQRRRRNHKYIYLLRLGTQREECCMQYYFGFVWSFRVEFEHLARKQHLGRIYF